MSKVYVVYMVSKGIDDTTNILGVYDDMTHKEPKSDSERIYFVCKRK